MKSAGTISISVALRSIVIALFGVVLMFMTSPLLSALTLGIASLPSLCHGGPLVGRTHMQGLLCEHVTVSLSRLVCTTVKWWCTNRPYLMRHSTMAG